MRSGRACAAASSAVSGGGVTLHVAVRALDAERARELLHQRDDVLRRRVFRKDLEVARRRAAAHGRPAARSA